MKRIMKDTFVAIALLTTLFSAPSYAQSCGADSCLPCGEVITNNPGVSYEAPVAPFTNYMATSSCCRNPNNYFGGFYGGVGWGLGVTNYHLKIQNSSPFGLDEQSRSYLVGNANLGFNLVINYFALGVEVGYDYRSRSNPVSYFPLTDSLLTVLIDPDEIFDDRLVFVTPCKARYDITSHGSAYADLLPGVAYKQFTAYLRFGIEQSKYQLQRRVCFPSVLVVEDAGFDVTIHDTDFIFAPAKRSIAGYRLGAGFGVAATRHVSFHLNFIHTFVNKQSFTPNVASIIANAPVIVPDPVVLNPEIDTFPVLGNLAGKITIEPQRNEVIFGVRFTL